MFQQPYTPHHPTEEKEAKVHVQLSIAAQQLKKPPRPWGKLLSSLSSTSSSHPYAVVTLEATGHEIGRTEM